MTRQADMAKIHIAKKDLGMDDDTYRAMLQQVAGVESASKLDFHGRNAVLHHLQKLGWMPKRKPKNTGPKAHKPKGPTYKKSQSDKIRALWVELADLGVVRNKSEAALMAYTKRMTGGRFEAPQFCDAGTASRLIESLKQWRKRAMDQQGASE